MAVTEYVTAISWNPTRVACVDACHKRMIDGELSDVSPTGRRLLYVFFFFIFRFSSRNVLLLLLYTRQPRVVELPRRLVFFFCTVSFPVRAFREMLKSDRKIV